ncbi:predicted protein [Histoplasma capsulatum G186AR]|uniref:Uncharacterized protein n=1 Tax=Ajellomyces capsulatus (strain G186AR / H82 / ATCC MYA-2454 / RMSCC 2432) TaxID=447093 RepID=C0NES9_AJECG|nr:uncharacterized protein HCBG_01395 [Histoplasma capsulatum G186AR]EEH09750.1 predicted protein [Histoplasma capsulatum G186AR]
MACRLSPASSGPHPVAGAGARQFCCSIKALPSIRYYYQVNELSTLSVFHGATGFWAFQNGSPHLKAAASSYIFDRVEWFSIHDKMSHSDIERTGPNFIQPDSAKRDSYVGTRGFHSFGQSDDPV